MPRSCSRRLGSATRFVQKIPSPRAWRRRGEGGNDRRDVHFRRLPGAGGPRYGGEHADPPDPDRGRYRRRAEEAFRPLPGHVDPGRGLSGGRHADPVGRLFGAVAGKQPNRSRSGLCDNEIAVELGDGKAAERDRTDRQPDPPGPRARRAVGPASPRRGALLSGSGPAGR